MLLALHLIDIAIVANIMVKFHASCLQDFMWGFFPPQSNLILNFKPLQTDVQNYVTVNNLNISMYVLNIKDGASFSINATRGYEPASLNKLPVAIVILKKVEEGKLSLDSKLQIKDYHRNDQSGTLYSSPITEMRVRDLLSSMLAESDNTAFRVLSEQVTFEDLQNVSSYLDYYTKDISSNSSNIYQITPKSTGNLFMSLYLSTYLKPEDSELILSDLVNNSLDIKKYANLPEGVTVSHKYGAYYLNNQSFFHDCGIMYIEESRIFYCIMTQGLDEKSKAPEVIGTIVNKIYKYVLKEP